MNFFYNKKNQRIIAGVIAGLLILAMVVTTVFNAFVASLAVIPLTSTLSIDTPFLIFSSASSEAAHTHTVPIVRITHAKLQKR